MSTGGSSGLFVRRRSGKLLILRLTPRGLRRLRLETTRSCRISSSTAHERLSSAEGGMAAKRGSLRRMTRTACRKESRSGSSSALQRGFVHQAANGEMRHHQPVEFLPHQVGGLAAQDDLGAAQVGLQFVQGGFDLPALVVERRQFLRRELWRDRESWSPADRSARRRPRLPAGNRSPAPDAVGLASPSRSEG